MPATNSTPLFNIYVSAYWSATTGQVSSADLTYSSRDAAAAVLLGVTDARNDMHSGNAVARTQADLQMRIVGLLGM